jgi:S1/P1 Nuclease
MSKIQNYVNQNFAKIFPKFRRNRKMKNPLICLLFIVVTATFSPNVLAWDDVGHKLTTYIAWERLNPQARQKISKILQNAPEDSDLSVLYPQDSRSDEAKEREHFMLASYWADIVRDRKFAVRNKKYHQTNWHYFDDFWSIENGQLKIIDKPGEDGGKAVPKLFEFEKVLRDASVSEADRSIALAWILHLGGDIHQPLHCSARVTAEEPKGDQGGNLFLLTPKDTPREKQENLHWFWDSIVKRSIIRKNDEPDATYLAKIGRKIMKKHPFEKMQNRLRLGKYDDWHKEGMQIATSQVFPPTLIRFQTPSESYKKTALKIAEEQIALAGYRMGETLNQIFGQ